jgi:membrane dipeptidase
LILFLACSAAAWANDDDIGLRPPVVLTSEGLDVHRSGILIDGHNDLPWQVRKYGDSSFDRLDIAQIQPKLHTDIPRLRRGGVGAQFWAVYVPPDTAREGTAASMARQQFTIIETMIARYPDNFALARSADDIVRIHADGKIASLIGVEGGHMIENSLDTLREFYDRGARYLGLTHSQTIDWADSATDEARRGGLTPFGESVVREMNRLGMLVDLAHVSHDTMRDAIRVSRAPVIASHSSAYAIAAHNRNVPDDVLRMIKDNGGVVMVNFYSGYVVPEGARIMAQNFEIEREMKAKYPDEAEYKKAMEAWLAANPIPRGTVHTIVDHIDHVVKIAGIDHVGIGGDYDGIDKTPEQLDDVSGYPYVTQALLDRGYSPDDIHKIMGQNLLRALRHVEEVARETQTNRQP